MTYKVAISIGANIGKPRLQIAHAIHLINRILKQTRTSRLYLSKAMYKENQPDFFNAMITGKTKLPPLRLLKKLQSIEKICGKNNVKNAPRKVDLDLISHSQTKTFRGLELTLPHPLAHERQFVMLPWAEICAKQVSKAKKVPKQGCRALFYKCSHPRKLRKQ